MNFSIKKKTKTKKQYAAGQIKSTFSTIHFTWCNEIISDIRRIDLSLFVINSLFGFDGNITWAQKNFQRWNSDLLQYRRCLIRRIVPAFCQSPGIFITKTRQTASCSSGKMLFATFLSAYWYFVYKAACSPLLKTQSIIFFATTLFATIFNRLLKLSYYVIIYVTQLFNIFSRNQFVTEIYTNLKLFLLYFLVIIFVN